MDETLELDELLARVYAAENGMQLLERPMRLNTEFRGPALRAHFDSWRELTGEFDWSDDRYVETMCRLFGRSLLA